MTVLAGGVVASLGSDAAKVFRRRRSPTPLLPYSLIPLALAFAPFPAQAQPASPSLAGHWIFETDVATANECTITGTAVLAQTDARGAYSVHLNAFERCRTGATWRAVQRCTARQIERAVHIDCDVVEATPANYAPDNFLLRIQSAGRMDGSLISSWNAPTRWRRARPALIS